MSIISLAVLLLFGISEMAMRATPRQHDGCGGSRQAAISPEWPLPPFAPTDLSALVPTLAAAASRADGYEIKHDGYRLIVRRDGAAVRLFTRRGHDWTERYPGIASVAGKLRARSFTLDGEAVVCGGDGVAVFDALHRRHKAGDAILYAFDLLEFDGEDFRPLPLAKRKARLARLLARVMAGIAMNAHRRWGAVVFRHAARWA
jgi:ATP-dependent DNA ligase